MGPGLCSGTPSSLQVSASVSFVVSLVTVAGARTQLTCVCTHVTRMFTGCVQHEPCWKRRRRPVLHSHVGHVGHVHKTTCRRCVSGHTSVHLYAHMCFPEAL